MGTRSKKISEMLSNITPEMKEKWKQERVESKKKLTLEYQLGYYVGLEIVHRYLPTLSTDMLQSRTVIEVSEEDWDCDMCSYNIEPENIKIYDDEQSMFTIIELQLDSVV